MTAHLLDKTFKYIPAVKTDIRATFERERKRLAAEKRAQDGVENVTPIKRKTK